jgi:S1-C subfamily serine protease
MITRFDGRSGGTGVIISSSKNNSRILTNAHVCELIKNGGLIRSERTKGIVKTYQISRIHDLCLITTNTNFKVNTVLANAEPDTYDDAVISGHPHLLPNIVTYGHFSQKELVVIMTKLRPCKIEDTMNADTAPYCQIFGGIPVVRQFEAQVVSATIMPGSSGSAVFNSKGEISGLVFAGSGNFGYAMIVPYEYIANFFDVELLEIPVKYPNTDIDLTNNASSVNWNKVCTGDLEKRIQNICDLITKSLLLTN